ncbi:MAG: DNA helicase II [Gammaproteobacteria bacterium]|nr:DNA helicase II [Gammaproteobacteria bacterium]
MQVVSWLEKLNPEQYQAVTAPLQNSLILAGAGSGKTRVLVNRIAWLIEQGSLNLSQVMAVTFTNKAASEMKQRLKHLLPDIYQDFWVGTFHGLSHRLLRRHHDLLGLSAHFQILDSDDQARMLKRIAADMQLDSEQWPVKKLQSFINQQKDEGIRPHQIKLPNYGPVKTYAAVYQRYHDACIRSQVVDFAELLLRTTELFEQHPEVLASYHQQFRLLLIDEFQDTNAIQYRWMRCLAGPQTVVMAVGDDDQSIYGWRGAKVENIRHFERDFSDVRVIRLEQNYRSSNTILQAANQLIANNQERMGKSLWTEGGFGEKITVYSAFNELEEALFVKEQIKKELDVGRAARDVAILYRSNAQSRVMEEALLRAGIAYRIHGGMRFFERAEIKDALSYLRLILNPHDDAAFERAIHVPSRGVGEKTLTHLRDTAKHLDCSLWQAVINELAANVFTARAANALTGFIAMLTKWQELMPELSLSSVVMMVLEDSGLLAFYSEKNKEKAESKRENLLELVNAIDEYSQQIQDTPSLLGFLTQAALEAGEWQADNHEDHVHLMTMHAAKGLEFPAVFMIGMEEGLFPSQMSMDDPSRLEEERRLCYVGMTRSMEKLCLTYAEVRRQYGREQYHRPSRFLAELPHDLIHAVRPQAKMSQRPMSIPKANPDVALVAHPFKIGTEVQHSHFGLGVVLALEGEGEKARIQVRFHQYGAKWLVLAYAKLRAVT